MKKLLFALLVTVGVPCFAQNGAVNGVCTRGGQAALTQGLSSTNYLQQVIPGCQVTVYLTGTTTLATLYSNITGTPLSNPFFATVTGSSVPGYFLFFALNSQGYDVVGSGGGLNSSCTTAPNCYPTPTTLVTDIFPSGGGAGCITDCITGSGTEGYYSLFTAPTTIGNGHINENSNPGDVTITEPVIVNGGGSTAGYLYAVAGSDPTSAAQAQAGSTSIAIYTADGSGNAAIVEPGLGRSRPCTAANSGSVSGCGGGGTVTTTGSPSSTQIAEFSGGTSITTATAAHIVAAIGSTPVAKATDLASYPTPCTGTQFSQGLSSGSNNCATPSGGGGGGGSTFSGSVTAAATNTVTLIASAVNQVYQICGGAILTGNNGFGVTVTWTQGSSSMTGSLVNASTATAPSGNAQTCVTLNPDASTAVHLVIAQNTNYSTGVYFGTIGSGGGSYPSPVTVSGTGVSSLAITTCITSSYKDYVIRSSNLSGSGSSVNLYLQASTNGGSIWDTTSTYTYTKQYNQEGSNTTGAQGASSTSGMDVSGGGGLDLTTATRPFNVSLTLYDPLSTTAYKVGQGSISGYYSGTFFQGTAMWTYQNANAVNAIQVIPSTGTITGSLTCQPLPQ